MSRTVLDEVLRSAPDADILVVDDNSPDGTGALVAAHPAYLARVFLLTRAEKDGLGAAYRAGFAWALARGYDVIVQMDADLSHPPAKIPELVAALGQADVAIGSRYVQGGGVSNWSWRRRAHLPGRQCVRPCGPGAARARRHGWLPGLPPGLAAPARGAGVPVERLLRSRSRTPGGPAVLGLTTTEVPITFTDRTVGESKMSTAIIREAVLRVLAWRWHEIRDRRPRPRRPR